MFIVFFPTWILCNSVQCLGSFDRPDARARTHASMHTYKKKLILHILWCPGIFLLWSPGVCYCPLSSCDAKLCIFSLLWWTNFRAILFRQLVCFFNTMLLLGVSIPCTLLILYPMPFYFSSLFYNLWGAVAQWESMPRTDDRKVPPGSNRTLAPHGFTPYQLYLSDETL